MKKARVFTLALSAVTAFAVLPVVGGAQPAMADELQDTVGQAQEEEEAPQVEPDTKVANGGD